MYSNCVENLTDSGLANEIAKDKDIFENSSTITINIVSANILCFGDSLTAGFYRHGSRFSPYAREIRSALFGEVDVIGMSGWTTTEMVHNMDCSECIDCCGSEEVGLHIKLQSKPFQYVLILAGTNDLGSDNEAEPIFENIKALVSACLERHVKNIGVMTVPACSVEWKFPSLAANRLRLNNYIRNIQSGFDERVFSIDITELLPNGEEFSMVRPEVADLWDGDGLHFSPIGSQTLGQFLTKQLLTRGAAIRSNNNGLGIVDKNIDAADSIDDNYDINQWAVLVDTETGLPNHLTHETIMVSSCVGDCNTLKLNENRVEIAPTTLEKEIDLVSGGQNSVSDSVHNIAPGSSSSNTSTTSTSSSNIVSTDIGTSKPKSQCCIA